MDGSKKCGDSGGSSGGLGLCGIGRLVVMCGYSLSLPLSLALLVNQIFLSASSAYKIQNIQPSIPLLHPSELLGGREEQM